MDVRLDKSVENSSAIARAGMKSMRSIMVNSFNRILMMT